MPHKFENRTQPSMTSSRVWVVYSTMSDFFPNLISPRVAPPAPFARHRSIGYSVYHIIKNNIIHFLAVMVYYSIYILRLFMIANINNITNKGLNNICKKMYGSSMPVS